MPQSGKNREATVAMTLGVDVGGTHVRACLVPFETSGFSIEALPHARVRWRPTDGFPSVADLVAAVLEVRDQVCAQGGVTSQAVVACGVGLAAQLDSDGRTARNAPNLGWRDLDVAGPLEAGLGLGRGGVRLINDLKAIVSGELAYGAVQGQQEVLAFYVGTGIGGAVVTGGRLVLGHGGFAGEIGHVKLAGLRAQCGCGQTGCVEAMAGGGAIERRIRRQVATGRLPTPPDSSRHAGESLLGWWDGLAADGNAWAIAMSEKYAEALALVLSGACTLLNPSVVLWGGGVLEHAPTLRARTFARTRSLTVAVACDRLTFQQGSLGDVAGAVGAAAAIRRDSVVLEGERATS